LRINIWPGSEERKAEMDEGEKTMEIEPVALAEVAEALSHSRPFADTPFETLERVFPKGKAIDRIKLKAGTPLMEPGETFSYYWLLLDGEMRAERAEVDGSRNVLGIAYPGEGFGEAALLSGKGISPFLIIAAKDCVLLRFSEDDFWTLTACCPATRKVILANMAVRFHTYQAEALHRQKLVSLGTLAAGLMHELHNPGSAAKRAASQLRQNLHRLQELSLRFSEHQKTMPQVECMHSLLEQTLRLCHAPAISSLEQADAEEEMSEWLSSVGVENAYSIGPALVGVGLKRPELQCAQEAFDRPDFSDALNWLEALVSSVSLVCTIEESITRVSDLVMAVKKFAYDEKSPARSLDVHDSLQSTLTILGHKLRHKDVSAEKNFAATPSVIQARGSSLSQVWTNLIDNAVDASPQGGRIEISTWTESAEKVEDAGWLAVGITDHGTGIPPEVLPRIFEAFFTTKPLGSGTGLGLEIVHRIVTQKFGGTIQVDSKPGNTRFVVRLPLGAATPAKKS
jgi:signal transduction histidine kinase